MSVRKLLTGACALAVLGGAAGVYLLWSGTGETTSEAGRAVRTTHEMRFVDGGVREKRDMLQLPDGTVIPDGFRTLYYESGAKKMEMQYEQGRQVGRGTFWHENGKKHVEGRFVDEKREGFVTTWHPSGQKASEGMYRAGAPAGRITTWLADGRKFEEGEYRGGLRHGVWWLYDEEGSVTEVTYLDGKPVRE